MQYIALVVSGVATVEQLEQTIAGTRILGTQNYKIFFK